MKLAEVYKTGIDMGIQADLRGAKSVKAYLEEVRQEYTRIPEKEKEFFDKDLLDNPYPDTRVFGDLKTEITKALAGIDISTGEVVLADRLGGINLIIAHHPVGKGYSQLHAVMHLQAEVLAKYGVPINIAQGIMSDRINEIERKVHPVNHNKVVDAAKLLNLPIMCAHTICDNMSATFVSNAIQKEKPTKVGEIMELLMSIPEYKQAALDGAGPIIFSGSSKNYAGKIVVTEFTGGTEGSKHMYERMSHAGIGTIISMHMSEESRQEANRNHINVVVAGHMSSDSLGMNLYLDALEKKGVEIVPCSGLIRVSRNKKAVGKKK